MNITILHLPGYPSRYIDLDECLLALGHAAKEQERILAKVTQREGISVSSIMNAGGFWKSEAVTAVGHFVACGYVEYTGKRYGHFSMTKLGNKRVRQAEKRLRKRTKWLKAAGSEKLQDIPF